MVDQSQTRFFPPLHLTHEDRSQNLSLSLNLNLSRPLLCLPGSVSAHWDIPFRLPSAASNLRLGIHTNIGFPPIYHPALLLGWLGNVSEK